MNAIEVEHLTKKFGDLVAVNDISFRRRGGRNLRLAGTEWRRENDPDPHDDNPHATDFGNGEDRGP